MIWDGKGQTQALIQGSLHDAPVKCLAKAVGRDEAHSAGLAAIDQILRLFGSKVLSF